MFTIEIEHNIRFFVFERRRAIFLRSELEMDKNGRGWEAPDGFVASRNRDLYSCDAFSSAHR